MDVCRNRLGPTPFVLPEICPGTITQWSGSIISIPSGWSLCDGTLGTPDLRDKFVVGAGATYSVDDTGGSVNHNHAFTGDGHFHTLPAGTDLPATPARDTTLTTENASGTTDDGSSLPTYYSLAYIMRL